MDSTDRSQTRRAAHRHKTGKAARCGYEIPLPVSRFRLNHRGSWPPPAFAFAECAVAAWPVVTVGFTVMPAGAERDSARPHPSQHSPHLCLSLLSYGRNPGPAVAGHDVLGSTRRLGSPLAVGDEFTEERSLEGRELGDFSFDRAARKPPIRS